MTERLARACAAHPRRTLALWGVAVVVALVLVATSLHGLTTQAHVIGNPQSVAAINEIEKSFPDVAAQLKGDVILISSPRYTVTSPQAKAFGKELFAELMATGQVSSPKFVGVSRDGHSALVSIHIASDSGAKQVEDVLAKLSGNDFTAVVTGYRSVNYDFGQQAQKDLEGGELALGLPAALIVLMLVFGAVVAGLVPLLMAIVSIIVAMGMAAIVSLEFTLSTFTVNMLTGMGLALGIDYSLFVVSRYREERLRGLAKDDAIAGSGATASRAVLFSGSTFVVALLGMFIVPTSIMRSLALGAIVVGITSVAAALTLLPALLSMWGDGVNRLSDPDVGRNVGRADASEGRFWRGIVNAVLRRPATRLAVSVGAMLPLAIPFFGMHIGANGITTLPNSAPSKQGYLAVQRAFPTQNPEPVRIVAVGGGSAASRARGSSRGCSPSIRPSARGRSVPTAPGAALLSVPLRGDPVGEPGDRGRSQPPLDTIPALFAGTGAKVYVGGVTSREHRLLRRGERADAVRPRSSCSG